MVPGHGWSPGYIKLGITVTTSERILTASGMDGPMVGTRYEEYLEAIHSVVQEKGYAKVSDVARSWG